MGDLALKLLYISITKFLLEGTVGDKNRAGSRMADDDNLLQIYFDQIRAYPLLEREEEAELARLAKEGDKDALQKLVKANLRLVIKIARPYAVSDVQYMDLIQEGNMGLMHAAEKFDHKKNVLFCTYAGWWIRQFITRYLAKKRRIVRLPHRKEEMLRKVQQVYHTLSQTLMRQPRTEEIACELGVPAKEIDYLLKMSYGFLPLELNAGKEDYAATMDMHEDYTYSPERNLFRQYYKQSVRRFIDKLKDREKQVITYRFQFEEGKPYTLKEIGAKLNISPEMVRQIELKALAKIRSQANDFTQFGYEEAI
jgi:RNA polymerase primary sigma factor